MKRILTIAQNTFRESVRDRVLYNLLVFVLLLIGGGLFFSQSSLGQEARVITDVGLSAMRLFGLAIAVIIGVSLVSKEIERRTIAVLLAKPVERYEFILGKYAGLCSTLFVNLAVMALAVTLALVFAQGGWNAQAARVWPAAYLLWLELCVLTAWALLFSAFSSPFLSALFTVLLFILGNWHGDLKLWAEAAPALATRVAGRVLSYVVPNLPNFNFIDVTARGQNIPGALVAGATLYAVLYVTALLAATALIFQRRNFK